MLPPEGLAHLLDDATFLQDKTIGAAGTGARRSPGLAVVSPTLQPCQGEALMPAGKPRPPGELERFWALT